MVICSLYNHSQSTVNILICMSLKLIGNLMFGACFSWLNDAWELIWCWHHVFLYFLTKWYMRGYWSQKHVSQCIQEMIWCWEHTALLIMEWYMRWNKEWCDNGNIFLRNSWYIRGDMVLITYFCKLKGRATWEIIWSILKVVEK